MGSPSFAARGDARALDHGPHGYLTLAAHAHADALGVTCRSAARASSSIRESAATLRGPICVRRSAGPRSTRRSRSTASTALNPAGRFSGRGMRTSTVLAVRSGRRVRRRRARRIRASCRSGSASACARRSCSTTRSSSSWTVSMREGPTRTRSAGHCIRISSWMNPTKIASSPPEAGLVWLSPRSQRRPRGLTGCVVRSIRRQVGGPTQLESYVPSWLVSIEAQARGPCEIATVLVPFETAVPDIDITMKSGASGRIVEILEDGRVGWSSNSNSPRPLPGVRMHTHVGVS